MARVGISTTVDERLLADAREARSGVPDSALMEDPVPQPSAVNLDSVESVSLATLVERMGRLGDERMGQICAALQVAVDCDG